MEERGGGGERIGVVGGVCSMLLLVEWPKCLGREKGFGVLTFSIACILGVFHLSTMSSKQVNCI